MRYKWGVKKTGWKDRILCGDCHAILRELPDYVVMWAWNYRAEVLKKFELARSMGVKFIIPVPKIEVV